MISLRDITKVYLMGKVQIMALRGVSLELNEGEMVAIIGASGSGKSTLMNIVGCLDRPTSGSYRIDGQDVARLKDDELALMRNRKLGFVFQSFNLLARTSAIDNVAMPLSYTAENLSEREARKRAAEMLARVGLADRLEHYPSQLSGGQQQRVAIARALINRPPVLFADEPTGNLDSKTSEEVLQMFERLNTEDGITIIMVTHDPKVAGHAKRVIRMDDGVILADAAPAGAGRETPEGGAP